MNDALISALSSVGGMALTGFFGFIVARLNSKKEVAISDRQLLSQEEKAFRDALREEVITYREEMKTLRTEINLLRETNIKLETENRILVARLEELTFELKRISGQP